VIQQPSALRTLFAMSDYRRLWTIGAAVGAARWLEFLALGVFAYEVTGSPPLVALLAIVRMLPYMLLGVVVGAMADHVDRRRLLVSAFLMAFAVSAVIAALAAAGLAGYGTMLAAAIMAGLLWTTDMPVRRRLLVETAGIERMTAALGFDNATHFATRAVGPIAGGIIYQWFGIEGVFALSALVYGCSVVLCARLETVMPPEKVTEEERGAGQSPLRVLVPPGELLRSRAFIVVLGVTLVFNVWCFPVISMVPVIGERVLGLSPAGIGALSACDGIGGTLGAIAIGMIAGQRSLFRVYYLGVLGFLAMLLALSAWLTLGMAVVSLLLIGVASAAFSATQYALVYTMAPPKMRGRATGFLSIFIGMSTVGFYNTGYLFAAFDPPTALRVMALEGLVPLLVLGLMWLRAKR
jgi:MFS family permease